MECGFCKRAVGDGPKRAPVHVRDGDETESFCPTCFVHVRAPMEIGRFAAGHYAPIACAACGWESVDFGLGRCGQCGSKFCSRVEPLPV